MINVAKALFVQAQRHQWTITVMYDDEAGYTGKSAKDAWRAVDDVSDDLFVHFHDADGRDIGWVQVASGLEPDETIIDGSAVGPVADLVDAIIEAVV